MSAILEPVSLIEVRWAEDYHPPLIAGDVAHPDGYASVSFHPDSNIFVVPLDQIAHG